VESKSDGRFLLISPFFNKIKKLNSRIYAAKKKLIFSISNILQTSAFINYKINALMRPFKFKIVKISIPSVSGSTFENYSEFKA